MIEQLIWEVGKALVTTLIGAAAVAVIAAVTVRCLTLSKLKQLLRAAFAKLREDGTISEEQKLKGAFGRIVTKNPNRVDIHLFAKDKKVGEQTINVENSVSDDIYEGQDVYV